MLLQEGRSLLVWRSGAGLHSGRRGFARRLRCGCGLSALLLLSLVSGCCLMPFIRLHLGLLGAVFYFVSASPVRIGCFVPLPAAQALFVCFRSVWLVRARGPALRLGVCLLGFPTVACAVTSIPRVTKRRSSWGMYRQAIRN